MIEGRGEELHRALTIAYGEYPPGWRSKFPEMMSVLDNFPKVNDRSMPYVTFFFFVRNEGSLATARFVDAFMSEAFIEKFVASCPAMQDAAKVTASIDERCFRSEVEAFSNPEEAISNPHLDISPLYRYMGAVQQDYIVLITDKLQEEAILQLRVNPYSYFAYGEDYIPLMPIKWSDL